MKNARTQNLIAAALAAVLALTSAWAADITPPKARAIAKEVAIYAFPYLITTASITNTFSSPGSEYKGMQNELINTPRVYTPADTPIQTPNSDTPYSSSERICGPSMVLTVLEIEKNRYYSIQLIDAYTFNFAYIGSGRRAMAPANSCSRVRIGKGEKPPGIKEVIRSETELVLAIYRTQVFDRPTWTT